MPTTFNIRHCDDNYMYHKIKGNGASVKYVRKKGQNFYMSRAIIGYIGGVPRYKILWYNIVLLLRWTRRCIL